MGKPWGILDSGLDAAARAAPAAPSALELPSHFQYFQAKSTVRKILEPHEFRSTIAEQRSKEMSLFGKLFRRETQTKPPVTLEEVSAGTSRISEARDSIAS